MARKWSWRNVISAQSECQSEEISDAHKWINEIPTVPILDSSLTLWKGLEGVA